VGRIDDRLKRLEERVQVGHDHELVEFFRRLTDDELKWLLEPAHEAASRVPCVGHVNLIECGCRTPGREELGLKTFPALGEEYLRRRNILVERADEIMERAPWGR
jgi:hypothetical protein